MRASRVMATALESPILHNRLRYSKVAEQLLTTRLEHYR